MKNIIKTTLVAVVAVLVTTFAPMTAMAACEGLTGAELGACEAGVITGQNTKLLGDGGILTGVINWVLIVLGFLAVIMLIYGGVRYTISAGDAKQVEAAKNTIMYAIIGLVIALLAAAIVNFVLGALVTPAA